MFPADGHRHIIINRRIITGNSQGIGKIAIRRDIPKSVIYSQKIHSTPLICEETVITRHLRVIFSSALKLEYILIRNAFEFHIHGSAGGVALLIRRKGFADLNAVDDLCRKLVELHGTLIRIC